ncbi:hypothetical protein O6H91_03G090800 [Diphasiastrum complanatum]|uniref:Uncharacterized protein n=1 Tax=Diphasiastrum complanatum TaxID=34168 RepID=A0ACC2E912_DIPCM|nr:hypothetical protein O6H91_03G090800 [Diphasiastrum complanatum]
MVYGLTESTGIAATTPPNDPDGIYGHVGKLASNMEAKVVDVETGICLPPNKSGELLLRGPCIMSGYLKNREATTSALDVDQWLHTGDLVFFDCNGYLFVLDRIKELIKYRGLQVTVLTYFVA